MSVTAVPSLDELVFEPARAGDLSAREAFALLAKLAVAQTVLLARIPLGIAAEPAAKPSESLLTIAEVAKRLEIKKSFAYELVRRGEIPHVRIGKKYKRVEATALERYLAQKSVDGGLAFMYSRKGKRG